MGKRHWIIVAVLCGLLALVCIYFDKSAVAGAFAVFTAVAAVFAGSAHKRELENRDRR